MKRTAAALLSACLLLSGCGTRPEGGGLYYEATGIAPETALLTVNGQALSAARYFYWLAANCAYLAQQAGGTPDWDSDAGGLTLGEYAKAQALDAAVFYAVLEETAAANGCVLTAEDLAAIDQEWAGQAADAGGADAYLASLTLPGPDAAGAQLFAADYYLYGHLRDLVLSGETELSPSVGEVAQYAKTQKLYTADTLLFDDAEKAELARSELERDIFADPADCKDGAYASVTAAPGDGTLPAEGESALAGLADGAWSQPTETAEGFLLLRPAPLDEDSAACFWFDARLEQLAESAEVTLSPEYHRFTAASFYSGLLAAQR